MGFERGGGSSWPREQGGGAGWWWVRGLGRGSREPRLRVARRALAKRRVSVEEPARLERPGAHRCDESLRRDESEARPRRSRRQGRERGRGGPPPGARIVQAFNSIVPARFNQGP